MASVEASESGVRIDVLMVKKLGGLTRNAAQRLLEEGRVTLNGGAVKKSHRVEAGEVFEITLSEPEPDEAEGEHIPLDVMYEDNDVIVVNKPKGMVVHPAAGHRSGTLVNALIYHCGGSLSGIGGKLRPGIVHRIDKDTSGLIIAAKNDAAHQSLSAQLGDRSLSRVYEAVVSGRIREDGMTINAPIGRHPTERKKMAVTDKNSKEAITKIEVLGRYEGYTHLRCRLLTGRTHQIRVHLSHIGHPILGDTIYGRKPFVKKLEGQCLHARTLKFIHPATEEEVEISTPLPPYFEKVLSGLLKTD